VRTRRLIVVTPEGERELLFIGRLMVGRAPECDISLADTKISRRHAEFDASGSTPRVTDLGSRNGILVNGRKVGAADLAPGDVITAGDARIRFEERAETSAPAEPAPAPHTGMHGPAVWRSGILQVLTLVMILMGAIFGALEVSTVAFAQEADAVWATGWLLGVFALASGLTGLYLGARPGGWPLSTQVLIGTTTLALATAVIPFIDGLGWYAGGMFAAGLGVSAVMIGAMQIIERALPRTRLTEALALAISGVLIGSAGAVALSGALIDAGGSSWGLAVGSVAALVGLLVAALARRALARAESQPAAQEAHPAVDGPGGSQPWADGLTTVPTALPEQSGGGTTPPA